MEFPLISQCISAVLYGFVVIGSSKTYLFPWTYKGHTIYLFLMWWPFYYCDLFFMLYHAFLNVSVLCHKQSLKFFFLCLFCWNTVFFFFSFFHQIMFVCFCNVVNWTQVVHTLEGRIWDHNLKSTVQTG